MNFPARSLSKTSLRFAVCMAAVGLLAAPPSAVAVTVSVTGATLSLGSGYGEDANESNPTRLKTTFAPSFAAQSFILDAGSPAFSFDLATVTFDEPNAHGGINSNERDDLGVLWKLLIGFDGPGSQEITMDASVSTMAGAISDSAIDYALHWAPVDVDLGSLGLFRVSLNNLEFSDRGSMLQKATITLLVPDPVVPEPRYPVPDPSLSVPEPGSMALIALGLAGIRATRRKKKSAA